MDEENAATLMALLSEDRVLGVHRVLPGWDMLQATLPTRAELEGAARVLVGAGLAEVDADWSLRLTPAGTRIRRSVSRRLGMRQVPGELRPLLARRSVAPIELVLPADVFDAAREAYLGRARRRAERRRPWWACWRQRGRRAAHGRDRR